MKTVGQILRSTRENKGLLLREVAAQANIDQAILSKIERGERRATKNQIIRLAEVLRLNKNDVLVEYLSDKIANEVVYEDVAIEALKVAQGKVKYLKTNHK